MATAYPGSTAQVHYGNEEAELQVVVLPRRALKWLQSLRLSTSVGRNIRRELSNGYVVAEILHRYDFTEHDQAIRLSSFENENSLARKLTNWSRIRTILANRREQIPDQIIDGTIHAKNGAAQHLLLYLFTMLTGQKCPVDSNVSFNYSSDYQATLPHHARSTVATAIKANVREQEYIADPNYLRRSAAVESVISAHQSEKNRDRNAHPDRYGRRIVSATGVTHKAQKLVGSPTRSSISSSIGSTMLRSNQFMTQRLNTTLSPINTASSPMKTSYLGPVRHSLKYTQRLDE